MNGAESLVRTLVAGGVDTCFTNPGTSEIHIVAALDQTAEMRCVLVLFEGVATGAADGYARMAGMPASTLLHLGPGLANGLANLHNAGRAKVPIVNIVGQHATFHLRHDAPLTSDIEGIGKPYSVWLRTCDATQNVGSDAAEAILAARQNGGQIATLILPADLAWSDGGKVAQISAFPVNAMPNSKAIERTARMLRSGLPTAIILGGAGLFGEGLKAAGRVAAATGAKLFCPYPFARLERGAGLTAVERVPYILEQATEQLKDFRQVILVGAAAPVAYFAYPGKSSVVTSSGCEIHRLATPAEDCAGALQALSALLSAYAHPIAVERANRPAIPAGAISLPGLATAIGAVLPENAIVVDESNTSGRGMMAATKAAPPHDWLVNPGGSIGIALPLAAGAAIACPERRVLCLTADGSAMYTAQALWTMAREGLNVTNVVFANHDYAVLKREFSGLGIGEPGPIARDMFEIGRPDLDWVSLSKGMGVPGRRVSSLDEFVTALQNGFESVGPSLIEVPL